MQRVLESHEWQDWASSEQGSPISRVTICTLLGSLGLCLFSSE